MKRTASKRAAAVLAIIFIAATAAVGRADISDKRYLQMRREISSLYLVQSLLSWFTRTQGERSVFQESYIGHEDLFSKSNIEYLDKLIKNQNLTNLDKRAVKYMRNAFTLEYVSLDTAHFDDEINNAESGASVKLDWIEKAVPYRQIQSLMANESNPDRRKKLQDAQAAVWRDRLNPIYAQQEKRVQQIAVDLGYSDYAALSQEYRGVNLKKLLDKSMSFYKETDGTYKKLLEAEVNASMGIPMSKFTRADIPFLSSVPQLKKFFPSQIVVSSFIYFLEGMGLDLRTAAGTMIQIDDEKREKKEPRAACFSISIPDDVRITVKPSGGISDFETFFHEAGHAMHFANTTNPRWEFQQLGNNAVTEGFAIFFETIWGEQEWLLRYRDFVKEYNRFAKPEDRVPVMTGKDIGLVIRNRVFWDLYMVRRYNVAKLLYETILHGGSPDIYKKYYSGQTDDLQKVYKSLFSDAYGFQLSDSDALRFRTDVDPFFYAADYSRAFLLAAQLNEYMRDKFGAKWFTTPDAGKVLRSKLWKDGGKLQSDELSNLIGDKETDFTAYKKRMKRRLDIANKLIR